MNKKLLVISISLGAALAHAQKLAPELEQRQDQSDIAIIVQYKATPTAMHHAKIVQWGGKLQHEFGFIRAAHYTVPAKALALIANSEDVAYVTPDRAVSGTLAISGAVTNAGYATKIGLNASGVGVAVIDSGIANVADLQGKIGGYQCRNKTYPRFRESKLRRWRCQC